MAANTNTLSDAKQDRQKHLHDKCFSQTTRSNTLANVSGQFTASSARIPVSRCFYPNPSSDLPIRLLIQGVTDMLEELPDNTGQHPTSRKLAGWRVDEL